MMSRPPKRKPGLRLFHVRRTRCKAGNSPPPIIRSCLAPAGFNPLVCQPVTSQCQNRRLRRAQKQFQPFDRRIGPQQMTSSARDDPASPVFPVCYLNLFRLFATRIQQLQAGSIATWLPTPWRIRHIVGAISPVSSPFRLPRGPGVPNLRQTKTRPLSPLNGQATMSSARRVGKLRFLSRS